MLSTRLRITKRDARWRIEQAELLGPRQTLSGEQLPPRWPNVSEAQRQGHVGPEHLRVIERFFDQLPDAVDYETRESAEKQLAELAVRFGPAELRQAADRLLYLLNQDGSLSDAELARRRSLRIGKQGMDGMSRITGWLDPEARATIDAVLAKWAARGMCNPDEQTPTVDGEPDAGSVQRDLRSQSQRNHDALKTMSRSVLASGQLGQHNGLPATIVVSTTLQELESGAGQAVSAGGTLMPISDLIRLASHACHYLVVFDKHSAVPLYLGRSRRTASAGQRIVLHARARQSHRRAAFHHLRGITSGGIAGARGTVMDDPRSTWTESAASGVPGREEGLTAGSIGIQPSVHTHEITVTSGAAVDSIGTNTAQEPLFGGSLERSCLPRKEWR